MSEDRPGRGGRLTIEVYAGSERGTAVIQDDDGHAETIEAATPRAALEKACGVAARRLPAEGPDSGRGPATAPTDVKRALLIAAIASLSLGALLVIVIFLAGDFGETESRLLLTTAAIAVYSITALGSATISERIRPLAIAGFAVSASGGVAALILTWASWDADLEWLVRTELVLLVLAVSLAHASLLLARRRPGDRQATRWTLAGTLMFIALLAAMLAGAVVADDAPGDAFWRILGSVAVLDLLGTVLQPVLRRLGR